MYTECPYCDAQFRIDIPQLKVAQGNVRCGHCNRVFNALPQLSEQPPTAHREDADTSARPSAQDALPLLKPIAHSTGQIDTETQSDPGVQQVEARIYPQETLPQESGTREAEIGGAQTRDDKAMITTPWLTGHPAETHSPDTTQHLLSGPENHTADTISTKDAGLSQGRSTSAAGADETGPAQTPAWNMGSEAFHLGRSHPARQFSPGKSKKEADSLRQDPHIAHDDLPIFAPDRRSEIRLPDSLHGPDWIDENHFDDDKTTSGFATLLWVIGTLGLLALLLVQGAYFMRADLASFPALRPSLEKLCSGMEIIIDCGLPLRRDVARITRENSEVGRHPGEPDALLVKTTLVNKAEFSQPYPQLDFTLSNADGVVIASRRFQPEDYLKANTDLMAGLPPAQPVTITLEIATPSSDFTLNSWSLELL